MDAPGSEDIVPAVRQMRLLGAVSDGGLRAPSAPHRRHPRGRGDRVRGGGAQHHRHRQLLLTLQTKMKIVSANGMGAF